MHRLASRSLTFLVCHSLSLAAASTAARPVGVSATPRAGGPLALRCVDTCCCWLYHVREAGHLRVCWLCCARMSQCASVQGGPPRLARPRRRIVMAREVAKLPAWAAAGRDLWARAASTGEQGRQSWQSQTCSAGRGSRGSLVRARSADTWRPTDCASGRWPPSAAPAAAAVPRQRS